MNKKEFILKLVDIIFTTVCFLVIVCICFLGGFAFGLNCKSIDNLSNEVSTSFVSTLSVQPLDTSTPNYQFTSSNFPFLIYQDYTVTDDGWGYLDYWPVVFTISSDYFTFFRVNAVDSSRTFSFGTGFDNPLIYNQSVRYDYALTSVSGSFEYYFDSNFNCNPVKFQLGVLSSYFGDSTCYESYVVFTDINGHYFQFGYRIPKQWSDNQGTYDVDIGRFALSTRTYYYSTSFDDNSFYQQGYETGYQNGVIAGENTGYTNGYSNGYDDGLIDGYDDGVVSANDYSFASLLTSVVGAPVTVFIDLLDFNIMGYSLLNIVMGLLTLGLVVLIIKLCLGGK